MNSSLKKIVFFGSFVCIYTFFFHIEMEGREDRRISNKLESAIYFYTNRADTCIRQYDFNRAKMYLDSASMYADQVNNWIVLGFYHQVQGNYYANHLNDYESHNHYYKALDYYKNAGEESQICPIYHNLAFSYIQKNDTQMLRKIIDKMLPLALKQKDEMNRIETYEIMAFYYSCLYEKNKQQTSLLDSIILYETKVVSMFENSQDIKDRKNDIAYNYIMLADNMIKKENYNRDSVSYYFEKAEQWSNPQDTGMLINCFWIKGEIAYGAHNIQEAENRFKQALLLMNNWSDKGNLAMYVDVCDRLSKIVETQKKYSLALDYERKKIACLNEIHDTEKYGIINELEVKYKTKQKDLEIIQLGETNRFRQKINWLYLGIFLLSVLSFFLIIRWMRSKKKATDVQLQLVKKEKKAIEMEKYEVLLDNHFKKSEISERDDTIEKFVKERIHLNKQIEDYSARVHKYEQRPKQSFISAVENPYWSTIVKEVYDLIFNSKRISERKKEYIETLQSIHDSFFLHLQNKYQGNLSAINIKYCICFAIGMDTLDIAGYFYVEPSSIRMAQHRLKTKFNIEKELDFNLFLKQLITD